MKITRDEVSDYQYIEGLSLGDERILRRIYDNFYHQIESFILSNSGTEEDARDIFQTSLKILYLQVREGLSIQRSFAAYLQVICQRRWYNQIKRKNHLSQIKKTIAPDLQSDEDTLEMLIRQERKLLFRKHFTLLPDSCRQILNLVFEENSLIEVAKKLGYSYNYVRKRSSECTAKLNEEIKNDPLFEELSI